MSLGAFRDIQYNAISQEPEEDALRHVEEWAKSQEIAKPDIIGWDFPYVSQEQINVFHMNGYSDACILLEEFKKCPEKRIQSAQKYAVITIKDPMSQPFTLIPNAYRTLERYMEVNHLVYKVGNEILSCFEREYEIEGVYYMDVYMAIEE